MTSDSFSWKIGGEAGFGIVTSGSIFAKTCLRTGMSVFDYMEYPSLIRGGHNTYQLTAKRLEITNDKFQIPNKSQNSNSKSKPLSTNHYPLTTNNYVLAPNKCLDILVALNKETITLHLKELCDKGLVLFDGEKIDVSDIPGVEARHVCDPSHCEKALVKDHPVFEGYQGGFETRFYSIPFGRLARENGGDEVMRNTVSLGASFAFLNCHFESLEAVLRETFEKKPEAAEANVKAARAGFEYVMEHYVSKAECQLVGESSGNLLITGNEAIGLGAISAGLQFYSAYPMTPSSSLLHYLADKQQEVGMVVKHVEDEIAAIQHALGASFAGVRAMTGTSGGGFSLMAESVGLAGITETPLVIMVSQRPGPATGLPTWTEQADLRFVIHSAQGEFPRVVLAPGDSAEAFHLTRLAFELAERYQIPVFILSDKYLSESRMTIPAGMIQEEYRNERYNIVTGEQDPLRGTFMGGSTLPLRKGETIQHLSSPYEGEEKGEVYHRYPADQVVNPRTTPGVESGIFVANSDEHDAFGATSEEIHMRNAQMERRMKRTELVLEEYKELAEPKLYGDKNSETLLVGWGSTKGVILETLNRLSAEGKKLAFLHFNWLWPFPAARVIEMMHKFNNVIVIENNYTGQLEGLLQQFTGLAMEHSIRKSDGRPFWPEELVELVRSKLSVG